MDFVNSVQNVTKKTQLVEFPVAANNTNLRIQFTDQPYLRGVQCLSIETFAVVDMLISPQGNALPTIANLQNAYLTLYTNNPDNTAINEKGSVTSKDSGEFIQLLPLVRLRTLQTGTAAQPFERNPFLLAGQTIYWEKSYLTLAAPLGNSTPISFLFNVGFQGQAIS